jgi:hypothetical protein
MKNSNDTIGNRTRDLPVCSAVPQPPRAPVNNMEVTFYPLHVLVLEVAQLYVPSV